MGPTSSIKVPSPAPYARSRLSRSSPARARSMFEGEEENEENGDDGEDKEIYCFCRKLSYGEMIACDNPECPYQWVSGFVHVV